MRSLWELLALVARHVCTVCGETWWRDRRNVGCACTRAAEQRR